MNDNKVERLEALLETNGIVTRYEGVRLPLNVLNVLPQPRKTFENITELALDIAKKNLLNPLIVARLDQTDCEKYLAVINELWGTNFELKDLLAVTENSSKIYYILLAGERRLRAFQSLWQSGCLECREKRGQEPEGICFRRHFGGDEIDVRLCRDIRPLNALFLQLSENTHMSVPPHEEAKAYALLFRLVRKNDGKFPMAKFAREVGRSPKTVKNALRFCGLPIFVQEAVENNLLPYGMAVELARLQEDGMAVEGLEWWMVRAMAEHYKVDDFRKMIATYLQDKNNGQFSLLTIREEEEEKFLRISHIRRTVERNMVMSIWLWLHYFQKVNLLFASGLLGQETSPFATGSPLRIFRHLNAEMRRTLPHLNGLMPKQILEQFETTTAEIEKQIIRLLEKQPTTQN